MLKHSIVRYGLFLFEILSAFLLRSALPSCQSASGGHCELLAAAGITIAAFAGQMPAVLCAALCGMLADISYSGGTGFFSFALPLCCYIVSFLFDEYLRRSLITVTLVGAVFTAVLLGLRITAYCGSVHEYLHIFTTRCLPDILCTLAAVPVYYALHSTLMSAQEQKIASGRHKTRCGKKR